MSIHENVYVGVKRVRAGTILQMISSILTAVSVVLAGISLALSTNPRLLTDLNVSLETLGALILISSVLVVVILILSLIAFILTLMGLSRAGTENGYFKKALIWVFINFALSIVANLFSTYIPESVSVSVDALGSVVDLIVIVFVTMGCAQVLPEFEARAKTIQIFVAIPAIITAVTRVISGTSLGENTTVNMICGIVVIITTLIYFFMYLGFLGKVKKKLEEQQTVV